MSDANTVARELRDLAREIEAACHQSRSNSMAVECVRACVDQLTLRALVIELQDRLDKGGEHACAKS